MKSLETGATWVAVLAAAGAVLVLAALTVAACGAAIGVRCW